MCGICGVFSKNPFAPVNSNVLQQMVDSIIHRGPDEEGLFHQPQIGLGSRRLSIIDVAGGQQPIPNENRNIWIVFNGEIYNFAELRHFLHKKGHLFQTQSDTEVILHLYEEFGTECLEYLDGIFAFAIWDSAQQRLFIARDRLGIKPLYYAEVNQQLIFGSELKVLLKHPEVSREIDLVALNEYLSFEYVPTPRTIFKEIRRLEPGHFLIYGEHGLIKQKFWDVTLARSELRPPMHWKDYSKQLYQQMHAIVKKELVSDVPVGVLLSGGVDSSVIAALMTEIYPGRVKSFSIGFQESSFDESPYARMVAEHLQTEHHELILTSKMAADMVPDIVDFLDEPFGDSSLIPTFLLSKFASNQVKVVLGGDGGDELFAGYPTLTAHRMIEYYERVIPWSIRTNIAPLILNWLPVSFNNISFDFRLRRFLSGRGVPHLTRHHRWLGSFTDDEKDLLLQDWLKPVLQDTYTQVYRHIRECDAVLPLNQILYTDMKMYLEGDILFKVDRASMAASLEVRVPFLNRDLVSFVSDIPFDLKLRRFSGKYLLKKSFRHMLPSEIFKRPKKGFNMPVAHWISGELRDLTLDLLAKDRIEQQGLFNYSYIKTLLDEHFMQQRDNRKLLWTLLVFQLWHSKYMSK
ncbi:MAG: asparagine synthase (glutamine-hydrolyzing) [Chloroflexota bacterium]